MKTLLFSATLAIILECSGMNILKPDARMSIAAIIHQHNACPAAPEPEPLCPLYQKITLGSRESVRQKLIAHVLKNFDDCTLLSHKVGNNSYYPLNIALIAGFALHLYKALNYSSLPVVPLKDLVSLLLQEHPESFQALEENHYFGMDYPSDLTNYEL